MSDIFSYITGILAAIFPALGPDQAPVYAGYVEADYVYVSPTTTGRISSISVDENQHVEAGDVLFTLDQEQLLAALSAAENKADSLKDAAENIRTGAREEELAVVRAELESARANQNLKQENLDRDLKLQATGNVPDIKVDQDRTEVSVATAQVAQLEAKLASMELPARSAALSSAESNADAALAEVALAKSRLDALSVRTPVSGRVETVFYDAGEVAAMAAPVVSILPDTQRSVIFYIDEENIAEFSIGDTLDLGCDGCDGPIPVVLEKIENQPEFTPPIIYSRDERSRLVFRAKAILPDTITLNPGQPVTLERPE